MTRRLLARTGIGISLLLATTAGCSSPSVPEEPTANTGGEPTASAGAGGSGSVSSTDVPKVAQPLDARRYVEDPCAVLSRQQVAALGANVEGEPSSAASTRASGPGCFWNPRGASKTVGVAFLTPNVNGLADTYTQHARGFFAFFEPIVVDGYPGVLSDTLDQRDSGSCGGVVAVNDKLTVSVGRQGGNGRQACEDVKRIASEVLTTLKENQ